VTEAALAEGIAARAAALGPWFHNIDLDGVATAPAHFLGDYPRVKWRRFERCVPADLSGASVLDIGCNAGFYAIEMKRRGAARVVGIDHDPRYLAQARFAAETLGLAIEYRALSVYEVAALRERFDVVLFTGVLYHLRHPLLALDLIRAHVTRDLFVYQSLQRGSEATPRVGFDHPFAERGVFNRPGYPKLHFVEARYCGDPTNWWVPNRACSAAMLRSAGFRIVANPEAEIFVCRHDEAAETHPPPVLPAGAETAP
jgi:tRNA (mo5U34)-methyltransferase